MVKVPLKRSLDEKIRRSERLITLARNNIARAESIIDDAKIRLTDDQRPV